VLRRNEVSQRADGLHPTVLAEAKRRSANLQLRAADRITAFAGSMTFVWIHAALFAVWMCLEKSHRVDPPNPRPHTGIASAHHRRIGLRPPRFSVTM
jgi:hypothetical protein